jgi:hypothetical protein
MWSHCDHFQDVDMNSQKWLADARTFHFCALSNPKDEPHTMDIYDRWNQDGVYDDFANKLGYRFRLVSAAIPSTALSGQTFSMNVTIANDGFARPTNPRNIEFVFRNQITSEEYKVLYVPPVDARLWLPGGESQKSMSVEFILPSGIPAGNYMLFMNLPDPKPGLSANPNYSIQLANTGTWEPKTGYNKMLATLSITHGATNR